MENLFSTMFDSVISNPKIMEKLTNPEFQNKVIAVAYVRKSAALSATEKSSADLWIAALYDRYLNGEGYLVFNTSGEKPKPETFNHPSEDLKVLTSQLLR